MIAASCDTAFARIGVNVGSISFSSRKYIAEIYLNQIYRCGGGIGSKVCIPQSHLKVCVP